jgi:hypothetical protein
MPGLPGRRSAARRRWGYRFRCRRRRWHWRRHGRELLRWRRIAATGKRQQHRDCEQSSKSSHVALPFRGHSRHLGWQRRSRRRIVCAEAGKAMDQQTAEIAASELATRLTMSVSSTGAWRAQSLALSTDGVSRSFLRHCTWGAAHRIPSDIPVSPLAVQNTASIACRTVEAARRALHSAPA